MNHNAPISPGRLKPEIQILAKFLVEKVSYFGSHTKFLLVIHKTGLIIETIPKDPSNQETILFTDLTVIEASSRNLNEMILGTKKNVTLSLFCSDRIRCICEIYHCWDKYILSVSSRLEKSFPSFDVSKDVVPGNHALYMDAQLTIYRTHLELIHKALKIPEGSGQKFIHREPAHSGLSNIISIPFYLIEIIHKVHSGIVIQIKKSQVKHYLMFYDMEKVNNLITKLQGNYKEYLDGSINMNEDEFNDKIEKRYIDLKPTSTMFFECKVYKALESGHLTPIRLIISDDYMLEVDINTNYIIQKYDLRHVEDLIQMASGLPGITISFGESAQVTYVPEEFERDIVASNIFTLITWKKPNQTTTARQSEFIHCIPPNRMFKVNCWLNDEIEPEYENDLIKSICAAMSEDEMYYVLHEFNLNAVLRSYNDADSKPLRILTNYFTKNTKTLKTKQFLKYWEALQSDLSNIYKHNIRKKVDYVGDKLRSKSFGNYEADQQFSIELNIKPFITVLYKTEELLKGLIILVSSKPLFKELCTNKKESAHHEDFLKAVLSLLETPYPTLNHLAGILLRSVCRFPSPTEKKAELFNKKFLLNSSRIELISMLSQGLARQILMKKGKQSMNSTVINASVHSILASLKILRTYLYDRKESTDTEDIKTILQWIAKPYYFAISNLLMRSNSLVCVYYTTSILNTLFQSCESPKLHQRIQSRFLNNSSLIPLNISLVFSSSLIPQRKLSMILLAYIFVENEQVCSLLLRIFPKYLFAKVDTSSNIVITRWGLNQWEQFFSVLVHDYDTPTEQWNEECRRELIKKLREIDSGVFSMLDECPAGKLHELTDPTFKNDGEFLLNLRWNHEEFEIQYDALQKKVPVWKYFLTSLVPDSEFPRLVVEIEKPMKLWNELNMQFLTTDDPLELRRILKTMILLYQEYAAEIKDINTIKLWLKSVHSQDYAPFRYLLLQLLYTCMTAEPAKVTTVNVNKFIALDGLKILTDVLTGLYFSDDHNELTMDDYENYRLETLGTDMDYNYTKLAVPIQAYTPSLKKAMSIFFVLEIYKVALKKPGIKLAPLSERIIYPMPKAKQQLSGTKAINALVNVLLLNNDALTMLLLKVLLSLFSDQEAFDALINDTPIFDFLLVNTNATTAVGRFTLLLKIYHKIADLMPTEDNVIKTYTDFSFSPTPPETSERAISLFPILRYLPNHLIWRLINISAEDCAKVFFSNSYESPELMWNSQVRENLLSTVKNQTHSYKKQIIEYSNSCNVHHKEDLPEYSPDQTGIEHKDVPGEVRCGPIILRVWAKKEFRAFEISRGDIPLFVESLYILLEDSMKIPPVQADSKHIFDLSIILEAHAKAIKLYSLKAYHCFPEIVTIMDFLVTHLSESSPKSPLNQDAQNLTSSLILALHKIIHHTIKLDKSNNMDVFLENKGFPYIISLLKIITKRVSADNSIEAVDYYANLKISSSDLKVLDLSIQIINQVLLRSPSNLHTLTPETKLQLFLNLQVVSKSSTALHEYIKKFNEPPAPRSQEVESSDEIRSSVDEDSEEAPDTSVLTCVFNILKKENSGTPSSDFIIHKLLGITKNLTHLLVDLSIYAEFTPFFIQAGVAWRCLEWLTYYNDPNIYIKIVEDPNYRAMLPHFEGAGNVFRNILIYTNEAYILKINSASIKPKSVGLTTTKQKPPKLLIALDQLEGFERTVLSKFHSAILELIGKPILQLLLTDYDEPVLKPQDENRENILRFLKIFATGYYDPVTFWSKETKDELKQLIQAQIVFINESHGRSFFNEVAPFEYKCHHKQLIIDGVFISSYNKTPTFKIPNPRQFIMKMLDSITQIWQWIKDNAYDSQQAENENNDLSINLVKLNDAAAGISNIIAYHGSEEVLLFEGNLTRLGALLNDKYLRNINDQHISGLKSMILSIFINLTKKLSGALKVVENVTIIRNMMLVLRENSKETAQLCKKIFIVVDSIFKFDNLRPAILNYGFFFLILEASLKTELYPKASRQAAFGLVKRMIQDTNNPTTKIFNVLFPPVIQSLVQDGLATSDEILEILDGDYDTPKIMWTKTMRHEILMVLAKSCNAVQNNWSKQQSKEVKVIENIVFWSEIPSKHIPVLPEFKDNVAVQNIFLKNFNKKPHFDEKDDINTFLIRIIQHARDIYPEFTQKVVVPDKTEQVSDQTTIEKNQRTTYRLSCEFITLLTTLLLTMNYKEQNPRSNDDIDTVVEEKKELDEGLHINGHGDQGEMSPTTLNDHLVSFIGQCIGLITSSRIGSHVLSTILQIIYLAIDDEHRFIFLKDLRVVHVLSKLLTRIAQPTRNSTTLTEIEEKLVLSTLLKILYKDKSVIPDFVDESLESIQRILASEKTYLRSILESIVTIVAQDPNCGREAFRQINKERDLVTVSTIHDCNPAAILNVFWRHVDDVWNPYDGKNTLNALLQKPKDSTMICPIISEHAVHSLPYSNEDSIKLDQNVKQYILEIGKEFANSKECVKLD